MIPHLLSQPCSLNYPLYQITLSFVYRFLNKFNCSMLFLRKSSKGNPSIIPTKIPPKTMLLMMRQYNTFLQRYYRISLNHNHTTKNILLPQNNQNTSLSLNSLLKTAAGVLFSNSRELAVSLNPTQNLFNNMSKGSVSVANLPHYALQNLTHETHTGQKHNFMNRVASVWNKYKKSMPVQGLLTGFFGLPPAKGDDTVWAAKFFMDAKEAY